MTFDSILARLHQRHVARQQLNRLGIFPHRRIKVRIHVGHRILGAQVLVGIVGIGAGQFEYFSLVVRDFSIALLAARMALAREERHKWGNGRGGEIRTRDLLYPKQAR
jgi:hypothetical protein